MSPDQRSPAADALTLLSSGRIEVEGRMPWSSNGTFLARVLLEDAEGVAIYKPRRAERPLWDFPDGLYQREAAAYELARQMCWDMVPPTVIREDGPFGVGSLQWFIDAAFEQHYFTLLEDERNHPALRRMAVFDVVCNNADRKGGHCLIDGDGRIWGIDHGLCFHRSPKLRTVIWDFAGEPIGEDSARDLERLVADGAGAPLRKLLHPEEAQAVITRAQGLLRAGRLPEPASDYPYPWPPV